MAVAGLSMLYSIVGVGLNAMPMAAFQDALTNLWRDRDGGSTPAGGTLW